MNDIPLATSVIASSAFCWKSLQKLYNPSVLGLKLQTCDTQFKEVSA